MEIPETMTISRRLGFAIEFAARWWFFDDYVLSDCAEELADAIENYGDRIKETADELCERFGSSSWHGEESPDEHLCKLAEFARRSGYETKCNGDSFILIARSDEEMIPHMEFIDVDSILSSATK